MATLAPLTDANACVTPEQFDTLLERGAFKDVHVELFDGTIVFKMSQGRLHVLALAFLNEALVTAMGGTSLKVSPQGTISMGDARPEPDLALVEYSPEIAARGFEGQDVRLAIEISVSTLAFDRLRKAALYSAQGIPEYWIANPVARQIEIYRDPKEDGYGILRVAGEDETIEALSLPGHIFRVADLMPDPDPA